MGDGREGGVAIRKKHGVGARVALEAEGARNAPEGDAVGGDAESSGGVFDGDCKSLLRVGVPRGVPTGGSLGRGVDGGVSDGVPKEGLVVGDGLKVDVGFDFVHVGGETAIVGGIRRTVGVRRVGGHLRRRASVSAAGRRGA